MVVRKATHWLVTTTTHCMEVPPPLGQYSWRRHQGVNKEDVIVAICFQCEPIPLRFDSILSFSLTIQVLRFVTELKPLTLQWVPELVGHACPWIIGIIFYKINCFINCMVKYSSSKLSLFLALGRSFLILIFWFFIVLLCNFLCHMLDWTDLCKRSLQWDFLG